MLTSDSYQRWSDIAFLQSDPILFSKNDIWSESCSGWNDTICIRQLSKSVLWCATYSFVLYLFFLLRESVSQIMGKNKTFPLNQKLTCANHGIYVATCAICHEQYVGQTKNKFSMRWSSHHSKWNRPNCEFDENNKDKVALLRHFSESHGNISKPPIHEAYTVTFVEETNSLSLDFFEDKCYHKLNAQINIQNMIFPRIR